MAGLAPAEAMGARELALRISYPHGAGPPSLEPPHPDRAAREASGEAAPGPRAPPAPSSRPAKLGPVGRQPLACAGRAQNLVSAGF